MKQIFFLVVCLISFTFAQAQVAFNPKIGVNLSKINSDAIELSQQGVRAGLNAGIDFRFGGPDSRVFFQPGLHYYNVSSNFKLHTTDGAGTDQVQIDTKDIISVHSLKVPVDIGVYLTNRQNSAVNVQLNAGVTPTAVLGVGDNSLQITKSDFESIYWGLNGGIGFDFSLVTLDFNYEHPLSDALNSIEGLYANGINGRNRVLTVSLGIVLPTK